MKQKSHSGLKKRLKVRKSGTPSFQKAGKRHLLANKSKRQKKVFKDGKPLSNAMKEGMRKLLPGKF